MNSKYKQSQINFLQAVAKLIIWAGRNGYDLTLGDGYRAPSVFGPLGVKKGYGEANSKHKERLAVDLHLHVDGKYQPSSEAHRPVGEKWESLGGTWGGRFAKKDGNHYSWGETR